MRCIIFLLRLTYYTSCQNCVYTVQQREEGECPHGQLTAQRETAVQKRLEEGGCMENDYSKMACASHPFVTMDTLYVCDIQHLVLLFSTQCNALFPGLVYSVVKLNWRSSENGAYIHKGPAGVERFLRSNEYYLNKTTKGQRSKTFLFQLAPY